MTTASEPFLQRLEERLGPNALVRDPKRLDPHLLDERKYYKGHTSALVLPADTQEVASLVALVAEEGVPLVPQGGNTGLCGGATPFGGLLVGLSRLNRIRDLDPANFTLTAEAGCTLQSVQEAAAETDRLFPLSLGAEGSCQIGGNISTNAGGIHVLRYGSMRDLVLGIEAVLPNGEIWNGLRALRKDNTGYDLKQLFIGGEGSLGIVTAAALKLFPRPRARATAYIALKQPAQALKLLEIARAASGDLVTAIEIIPQNLLALTQAKLPDMVAPIDPPPPWALILELSGAEERSLTQLLESCLSEAFDAGALENGVIAQNEAQRANFWKWREAIVWARKQSGPGLANDLAVPISSLPRFLERCTPALEAEFPGLRIMPFGHIGDGNLHYNMLAPEGMSEADFDAWRPPIIARVNAEVDALGGSISAEHGLGRLKAENNLAFKPAVEIAMMRAVKQALDPKGIMNPGVVLP